MSKQVVAIRRTNQVQAPAQGAERQPTARGRGLTSFEGPFLCGWPALLLLLLWLLMLLLLSLLLCSLLLSIVFIIEGPFLCG